MRDSKVVICGIGRDIRAHLARTASRIERLGEMFADYRVIIFENDSLDATVEFLEDWSSQNSKVNVITERLGAIKFPEIRLRQRAESLASYRNRYLQVLRDNFSNYTHTIVVDLDLVGGWSYQGIADTFGHDNWDAVGSNGLEFRSVPPQSEPICFFYDTWAFQASSACSDQDVASRSLLLTQHKLIARGTPLLPVNSCFGGMGVYRTACLLECEYGGDDCEHVVLHRNMRDRGMGRIFLNPSQITLRSAAVY
jgi:hypothetical protein